MSNETSHPVTGQHGTTEASRLLVNQLIKRDTSGKGGTESPKPSSISYEKHVEDEELGLCSDCGLQTSIGRGDQYFHLKNQDRWVCKKCSDKYNTNEVD